MSDPVKIKARGQADWVDVDGAVVEGEPQPGQKLITIPIASTIGARMTAGLGTDWLVFIGDLDDTPEGELPDVWNGVVRTWLPGDDDTLRLVAQAAASIEDMG